jgi:ribosomal protein S25
LEETCVGKEKRNPIPERRAVPAAIVFILVGILFLLALIGFTPEDSLYFSSKPPAHPHHFLGKPGVAVASALLYYYGRSAFFLLFFIFYTAFVLLRRKNREKRAGLVIFAFSTVVASAAFFSFFKTAPVYEGGGVFGNFLAGKVQKPLGKTASVILFSALSFGVVLLLLKFPLLIVRRIAKISVKGLLRCFRRRGVSHPVIFKTGDEKSPGRIAEASGVLPFEYRRKAFQVPQGGSDPPRDARILERPQRHDQKPPLIRKVYFAENGSPVQVHPSAWRVESAPAEASVGEAEPTFRRRKESPEGSSAGNADGKAREAQVEKPVHDSKGQYILPALDGKPDSRLSKGTRSRWEKQAMGLPDVSMLKKSKIANKKEREKEIQKKAQELERTLMDFGIEAKVIGITRGPVITRYELQPAPGVKLSRIVNLSDNIALSLSANGVRIEAPIPGRSAVGIEIPNEEREIVTFGDIVQEADMKGELPLILGRNITGRVVVDDLTSMPHLLIAGATGSGKSVCVNSLIMSLLFSKSVDEVRFIMIDPKMVELKVYNGIPHLLTDVVTDPRDASKALRWVIREMENRYRMLDENFVRDIKGYNQKSKERIPYIILIVDEFANLMAVSQKDVEEAVVRLAAMSRAVGIHLIMATQRPSVDVITGLIKANFPYRIAFQVASKTDSRTILDSIGAEKLLGRGDMLFSPAGSVHIQRIQGAYITEEEVQGVVQELKKNGEPEYVDDMFSDEQGEGPELAEDDPIFDEAVEVVMKTKRASASFLQRRLKIGYNRAARLIELMEEKGIIGPPRGSKPRDIYAE